MQAGRSCERDADNVRRTVPDEVYLDRRRFVHSAALAIAAAQLGMLSTVQPSNAAQSSSDRSLAMAQTMTGSDTTAIRSFAHLTVQEAELVELRRRINTTRWPTRELVNDQTQGVQLAMIQALAAYWGTDYNWRKCEARLNAIPQFLTEIDGQEIHFIHARSKNDN